MAVIITAIVLAWFHINRSVSVKRNKKGYKLFSIGLIWQKSIPTCEVVRTFSQKNFFPPTKVKLKTLWTLVAALYLMRCGRRTPCMHVNPFGGFILLHYIIMISLSNVNCEGEYIALYSKYNKF